MLESRRKKWSHFFQIWRQNDVTVTSSKNTTFWILVRLSFSQHSSISMKKLSQIEVSFVTSSVSVMEIWIWRISVKSVRLASEFLLPGVTSKIENFFIAFLESAFYGLYLRKCFLPWITLHNDKFEDGKLKKVLIYYIMRNFKVDFLHFLFWV